jgi:hypothetical protein
MPVFTHGPQGPGPGRQIFRGGILKKSFSVLGRINNYLRTSQTQARLNHLAILAIENDLTVKLDFENVISGFASTKARKSFS